MSCSPSSAEEPQLGMCPAACPDGSSPPSLLRRVPRETSQAPGCSSPSLRANLGSALPSHSFCLQAAGYEPLPRPLPRATLPTEPRSRRAGDGAGSREGAGGSASQARGQGRQEEDGALLPLTLSRS